MTKEKIVIKTSIGELTLRQIAEITRIPVPIIRGRYYKGWDGDRLLNGYEHPPKLFFEYNGRQLSLSELSAISGLSENAIYLRYKRGNFQSIYELLGKKRKVSFSQRIGERHGNLVIVGIKGSGRHIIAECVCDCGNRCEIGIQCLLDKRHGHSCGCMNGKQSIIHGKSKTTEHRIWRGMIQRCYNTNTTHYKNYGGRGIEVCDRWRYSFLNFFNDMGARPSPKHSIDRIDNDGPYSPENCRWATQEEQAKNKRNVIKIEYKGGIYTCSELAKILGLTTGTVRSYYHQQKLDSLLK